MLRRQVQVLEGAFADRVRLHRQSMLVAGRQKCSAALCSRCVVEFLKSNGGRITICAEMCEDFCGMAGDIFCARRSHICQLDVTGNAPCLTARHSSSAVTNLLLCNVTVARPGDASAHACLRISSRLCHMPDSDPCGSRSSRYRIKCISWCQKALACSLSGSEAELLELKVAA
jgi:hypothetical protein